MGDSGGGRPRKPHASLVGVLASVALLVSGADSQSVGLILSNVMLVIVSLCMHGQDGDVNALGILVSTYDYAYDARAVSDYTADSILSLVAASALLLCASARSRETAKLAIVAAAGWSIGTLVSLVPVYAGSPLIAAVVVVCMASCAACALVLLAELGPCGKIRRPAVAMATLSAAASVALACATPLPEAIQTAIAACWLGALAWQRLVLIVLRRQRRRAIGTLGGTSGGAPGSPGTGVRAARTRSVRAAHLTTRCEWIGAACMLAMCAVAATLFGLLWQPAPIGAGFLDQTPTQGADWAYYNSDCFQVAGLGVRTAGDATGLGLDFGEPFMLAVDPNGTVTRITDTDQATANQVRLLCGACSLATVLVDDGGGWRNRTLAALNGTNRALWDRNATYVLCGEAPAGALAVVGATDYDASCLLRKRVVRNATAVADASGLFCVEFASRSGLESQVVDLDVTLAGYVSINARLTVRRTSLSAHRRGWLPRTDMVRDDCAARPCAAGQVCANWNGTRACGADCPAGFAAIAGTPQNPNGSAVCTDIDECGTGGGGTDLCPASAFVCANTLGSFLCTCRTGIGDSLVGCAARL